MGRQVCLTMPETSTYTGIKVGIGKAFNLNDNTDITSSISYLDYDLK